MTTIDSISASTQTNLPGAKPDVVGYDAFLQLLIAQLRNQDPTKPIDSTEYVSQLATLSELEQSVKQTGMLERVLAAASFGEAGSIIGRRVTSADGAASGIAVAARLGTDGTTVVLEGGGEFLLGTGVRIERA
jgi:flagellar basal-body rod modification protein FlgD